MTWNCSGCTYENHALLLKCEMCGSSRPTKALTRKEIDENEKKNVERMKERKNEPNFISISINIPGFEPVPCLQFFDKSVCSVSAFQAEPFTQIEQVSMSSPFCMLIALFVVNFDFFEKIGILSPYALYRNVKDKLNLKEGMMLDVNTLPLLQDVLDVNIDIRFKEDGDNYNQHVKKNRKTLAPIILKGNHYKIPGLGV